MKKIVFFVSALLLIGVSACKEKKSQAPGEPTEFQLGLSAEDSTSIVKLGDECMTYLKNGKIDEALGMLCQYDDSLNEIAPLSEEQLASYKKKFLMFPVREYQLAYFSFTEEGLNDLKYDVVFGPEAAGNPKTSYMFNPVKVNGEWHLSVKTAMQDVDEQMR
ncbi:MAG: hypothetical protein IJ533_02955 [Prevotella sp.]|nr:hypothetical protein [Prevotella sp.]